MSDIDPVEAIAEVHDRFWSELPDAANGFEGMGRAIATRIVSAILTDPSLRAALLGMPRKPHRARGGLVTSPPGDLADYVPVALSGGGYRVTPAQARRAGKEMLDRINQPTPQQPDPAQAATQRWPRLIAQARQSTERAAAYIKGIKAVDINEDTDSILRTCIANASMAVADAEQVDLLSCIENLKVEEDRLTKVAADSLARETDKDKQHEDIVEEYQKREETQDRIRERLTADVERLTKERDEERAEVDKLVNTNEDDEYLAMVELQRGRALAMIERVKAVADRLVLLRDAAAQDDGARNYHAPAYADAYDYAARLLWEALDAPTKPAPDLEREPDAPSSVDARPSCRYCGADCSINRSWDGADMYACPECANARAARHRAARNR